MDSSAGGTRQLDRNGRHWLATTTALGTRLSFMYPGSNRGDPSKSGNEWIKVNTGLMRAFMTTKRTRNDEAYLHKTRSEGGRSEQKRQLARVCAVINGHLVGKKA